MIPVPLLPRFRAVLARHQGGSLVPQPALATFMESGEFAAHLRKMRRLYARRQKALLAALERYLPEVMIAAPDPSGMHLVARLGPALRIDDTEAARRAEAEGITLRPLSRYFAEAPQQGFVLGYAGFDETVLEEASRRLAEALG